MYDMVPHLQINTVPLDPHVCMYVHAHLWGHNTHKATDRRDCQNIKQPFGILASWLWRWLGESGNLEEVAFYQLHEPISIFSGQYSLWVAVAEC